MECKWHPGEEAVFTCLKCGEHMCRECVKETGQSHYCKDCYQEEIDRFAAQMGGVGPKADRRHREKKREAKGTSEEGPEGVGVAPPDVGEEGPGTTGPPQEEPEPAAPGDGEAEGQTVEGGEEELTRIERKQLKRLSSKRLSRKERAAQKSEKSEREIPEGKSEVSEEFWGESQGRGRFSFWAKRKRRVEPPPLEGLPPPLQEEKRMPVVKPEEPEEVEVSASEEGESQEEVAGKPPGKEVPLFERTMALEETGVEEKLKATEAERPVVRQGWEVAGSETGEPAAELPGEGTKRETAEGMEHEEEPIGAESTEIEEEVAEGKAEEATAAAVAAEGEKEEKRVARERRKDDRAARKERKREEREERKAGHVKGEGMVALAYPDEYTGELTERPRYLRATLVAIAGVVVIAGVWLGVVWLSKREYGFIGVILGIGLAILIVLVSGRHFNWQLGLMAALATGIGMCAGRILFYFLRVWDFLADVQMEGLPAMRNLRAAVSYFWEQLPGFLWVLIPAMLVAFLIAFRPPPLKIALRGSRPAAESEPAEVPLESSEDSE